MFMCRVRYCLHAHTNVHFPLYFTLFTSVEDVFDFMLWALNMKGFGAGESNFIVHYLA